MFPCKTNCHRTVLGWIPSVISTVSFCLKRRNCAQRGAPIDLMCNTVAPNNTRDCLTVL